MHFNGMTLRFDCFTSSREIGAFWQSKVITVSIPAASQYLQQCYFSSEIYFSFRFYKFLYQSFLFLYYISIILDNYFRFYKFSCQSFLFLYYIRFDIVGLAYVFHTNSLSNQQYHHTVMH